MPTPDSVRPTDKVSPDKGPKDFKKILHFDALSHTQYKHFVQDDDYPSVPRHYLPHASPEHLQKRLPLWKILRTPSDAAAKVSQKSKVGKSKERSTQDSFNQTGNSQYPGHSLKIRARNIYRYATRATKSPRRPLMPLPRLVKSQKSESRKKSFIKIGLLTLDFQTFD